MLGAEATDVEKTTIVQALYEEKKSRTSKLNRFSIPIH